MSDKLNIANEMAQLDTKNRDFYDSLTSEELKKFSNYLMIRWASSVEGSADLQNFYIISTNEQLNKHFFAVNKHPKLQWLMATSVSPGLGKFRHQWIGMKKKDAGESKVKKILMNLYPTAKESDIETLSKIISKQELKDLLRDHGNTDKD